MHRSPTLFTILAIAIASLFACKKEEKQKQEPAAVAVVDVEAATEPAPAADPASDDSALFIGESKITVTVADSDLEKIIAITSEGKVMAGDDEIAALATNGEMSINGEVVSTLAQDGTLSFKTSSKTMSISESGEVTDGGKVMLLWNEDGTLGGEAMKEMEGMSATFEGAPESRRAASYAFLAGMMMVGVPTEETAVPKAAPAHAPEAAPAPSP